MLDVEAFILVGGASSRMGEDKSRLLLNGRTTVSMVAEALQPVTTRVRVVGSNAEPADFLLPNIPDVQFRWGPLGGIHAALRSAETDHCIIVACDLPFVTADLFKFLLKTIEASDAVVPLQPDGRPQPLCSVYRREPCLSAAEESIAGNQHSPRSLLDLVATQYVNFDRLSHLRGSEHFFFNLNRREDYEVAKKIVVTSGRVDHLTS